MASGNASTHFEIGNDPTAMTADSLLPAEWAEYFTVTPGQRVAVFQGSGSTTVSITECAD